MVNLAEKHDEDGSAQLADTEISRILTALQKAEFKRSKAVMHVGIRPLSRAH